MIIFVSLALAKERIAPESMFDKPFLRFNCLIFFLGAPIQLKQRLFVKHLQLGVMLHKSIILQLDEFG